MAYREYDMFELLDRLGIELSSNDYIECPFCADPDTRKTLHIKDNGKGWRCNKCGAKGAPMHFYSRYVLGEDFPEAKDKRSEVAKKMREFMGDNTTATQKKVSAPKREARPQILPASDEHLHAVYTAMAGIPALQLTKAHKQELLKRGLSEDVIIRNGYRSIPDNPVIPDLYTKMYEAAGGNARSSSIFKYYSSEQIKLGLMVAHTLTSMNFDLKGVPGFYKFGPYWCLWSLPGILIPTRNHTGQIVVWQIRRKTGNAKYMTLSCQDLPQAVNTSVSRCHHPLSNAPLSQDVPILFTEGPLKADVASHLYGSPVFFLAIPGIQTRNDLLASIARLKEQGYCKVYNCLDMDRLTNPNVRSGSRVLTDEIHKLGVQVEDIFWGSEYAKHKFLALKTIALLRKVPVQYDLSGSVFTWLDAVSEALNEAGIKPCTASKKKKNGKDIHYYWENETKGIDDYLFLKKAENP